MNKRLMFLNLIANVEEVHEEFDPEMGTIRDQLFELQNRQQTPLQLYRGTLRHHLTPQPLLTLSESILGIVSRSSLSFCLN